MYGEILHVRCVCVPVPVCVCVCVRVRVCMCVCDPPSPLLPRCERCKRCKKCKYFGDRLSEYVDRHPVTPSLKAVKGLKGVNTQEIRE